MLFEDRVRTRAVRPHCPNRLDVGPAALVVFPPRVGDQSIVERVRQIVAVLVDAQPSDLAAIGPHDIEIAARFVFVVFIALERRAAALGNEYDVAVGGVSRVQVAPFTGRQLTQPVAIDADFKDVRGFLGPPQAIALRTIEPTVGRLVAVRHRVSEDNPLAIPIQIHPVYVTRPQRAVQHGGHS